MPITYTHEIVARPVSWLWPTILPAGKLVMLDGDPDMGKSLVTLDLSARLTTGREFLMAARGPARATSSS